MPLIVPLQPIANQTIYPTINSQQCQLNVYQLSTGLYVDLLTKNTNTPTNVPYSLVTGGVQCHNLHVIVRWQYLGFTGDLLFSDQQALADPFYTGLGSRYLLFYLFPNELPGLVW